MAAGGGAIQKQIAAASLNEPKQIPDSILNTWLLNANAYLITDEKNNVLAKQY